MNLGRNQITHGPAALEGRGQHSLTHSSAFSCASPHSQRRQFCPTYLCSRWVCSSWSHPVLLDAECTVPSERAASRIFTEIHYVLILHLNMREKLYSCVPEARHSYFQVLIRRPSRGFFLLGSLKVRFASAHIPICLSTWRLKEMIFETGWARSRFAPSKFFTSVKYSSPSYNIMV